MVIRAHVTMNLPDFRYSSFIGVPPPLKSSYGTASLQQTRIVALELVTANSWTETLIPRGAPTRLHLGGGSTVVGTV